MVKKVKSILHKADKIKKDVRKNVATAILAAFAFVIALVWRDAIRETVNQIVDKLGITSETYIYKVITAVIITIICVIGITFFSKWSEKDKK